MKGKMHLRVLVGVLLPLLVAAAGTAAAAETASLVITYQDGSVQEVALDRPAAAIVKLEFGGSGAVTVSIAGRWRSDWGDLEIRESGNRFSGNYPHDNGRLELVRRADGKTYEGTWSEAPSYAPPGDAGRVVLILAQDGQSFSGTWWYGQDGNGGVWNGTRIK